MRNIVFAVLLATCAGTVSEGAGRTYTIAFTVRDVPSPFALMTHGGPHWVTLTLMFDTLVWKDEKGVVPLLARSWESSPDARTWTFLLGDGIAWHDGATLTADDVHFTFDYLRKHPLPMWIPESLRSIERIETEGPRKVTFRLREPAPDFLETVAAVTLILPRHVWEQVSDPLKYTASAAFIGSGPFRFVETRRGEYHLFTANPRYFLGRPAIDRLVIKAINNPALALKSGDIDAAGLSSPLAAAQFQYDHEFAIVRGPYSYYLTKLVFNVNRAPFDQRLVRQAVAYALDRPEIVRQALEGNGIVSSAGLLHPDSPWFAKDLLRYEHDVKRAEELLDEAGCSRKDAGGIRLSPNGSPLSFTLYQRAESPEMARQAEMIRAQLAAVGIELVVKPMSTGPLEALLAKGEFDIAFDSHGGTIRLSIPALNPDFPARGYHNNRLAELYNRFSTTTDEAERRSMAHEIQRTIADELPAIAIANPGTMAVYRKSQGVRWFWTREGLGMGAPIWWNKLALIRAPLPAKAPASRAGVAIPVISATLVAALAAIALRWRRAGQAAA